MPTSRCLQEALSFRNSTAYRVAEAVEWPDEQGFIKCINFFWTPADWEKIPPEERPEDATPLDDGKSGWLMLMVGLSLEEAAILTDNPFVSDQEADALNEKFAVLAGITEET